MTYLGANKKLWVPSFQDNSSSQRSLRVVGFGQPKSNKGFLEIDLSLWSEINSFHDRNEILKDTSNFAFQAPWSGQQLYQTGPGGFLNICNDTETLGTKMTRDRGQGKMNVFSVFTQIVMKIYEIVSIF